MLRIEKVCEGMTWNYSVTPPGLRLLSYFMRDTCILGSKMETTVQSRRWMKELVTHGRCSSISQMRSFGVTHYFAGQPSV